MINPIVKTIELPDGRTITLETGKLAKQADGSVMLRMGNTMLLATVCAAKDAVPGTDFMPLQVEYKEKFAAFGRFPGGFTKREGRASDYEILTCRLVDRALRPLFPDNYHAEVYVNIILFSADGVDMPDALAGLAASAALAVSDIPFNGPISEVRVARIDGQFVINPTFEQLEKADMDLMVAATYENIMMVEGEMHEVSEAELLEAMKVAHEAIKVHCKAQMELTEEVGKTVKREYNHEVNDEELRKAVREACYDKAYAVAASGNNNKHERFDAFDAIREEFKAQFSEEELEEKAPLIDRYYHDVEKEAMRRSILDEGKRLDGRKTTEIRPIWCEVGPLPGPHGSAIFTRGETQSLTSVTLGTKLDEKIIDNVLEHGKERFLLHYNFPPFSTGEAKAQRGVGRREIGHLVSSFGTIGRNIVQGIWSGISGSLSWIKSMITGWVGNVKNFLKSLFGINSPSTWARDMLGVNIARGIGVGFEDEMVAVERSMEDAMPDLSGSVQFEARTVPVRAAVFSDNAERGGFSAESESAILAELRATREAIQNMGIYLDDGTLVGRVNQGLGMIRAGETRRKL